MVQIVVSIRNGCDIVSSNLPQILTKSSLAINWKLSSSVEDHETRPLAESKDSKTDVTVAPDDITEMDPPSKRPRLEEGSPEESQVTSSVGKRQREELFYCLDITSTAFARDRRPLVHS